MKTTSLPPRDEMIQAFLRRDARYEGVFVTAVRTTGVFCRPGCPARSPRPDHVEFFATPHDALLAGYRPCRRCTPMEPADKAPKWLHGILRRVDENPSSRVCDSDIRALGVDPVRVRRWFQRHHNMTFQAYCRTRRLGLALGAIQDGHRVTDVALDSGYESLSGFAEAFRAVFGTAPTQHGTRPLAVAARFTTPLGPMVACANKRAVLLLEFADRRMLQTQLRRLGRALGTAPVPGTNAIIDALERELCGYFAGRTRRFTVPVEAVGTPFQERVWNALREIPYASTCSYGELATRMQRPSAVRAVARANGDNRLAILIPCHRVIGADGSLTGYGGGLWRKRRLLEIEGVSFDDDGRAIRREKASR